MAVARAGEDAVPVEPAPVALRPFLQFARLPAPALVAARRVLDADEAFRARVAEEVSEEVVGRAGWLFLARPDGWEDDLDALVQGAEESRAAVADRRAENEARRRLAAVEAAAKRAEDVAVEARAEAARAGDALVEERRARRDAVEEAEKLAIRARQLQAERDRARAAAAAAEESAKAAEEELGALRGELKALEADVAAPRAEVPPAPAGTGEPAVNVQAAAALGAAARAARGLADALAGAADALGAEAPVPEVRPSGDPGPASEASPSPAPRPRMPARPARAPRRAPAPLPPGILEDSSEAAEHLARLRGVVLLVDGYNVSLAAWPGTPIADQRRRLVDALGELASRTGADVRVVFDGSETVDPPAVSTTSRIVRVRFSPPDVEADDVIVAEVAALPASRPVVVASSDRRVRDECRAHGANLLRSSQLLALLRLR